PKVKVHTNQRRAQMDYRNREQFEENPHINYEPSMLGGYKEASKNERIPHKPAYNDKAMSAPINSPNNYGKAGETYSSFKKWEREKLIKNLSEALDICDPKIQEAMIEHFTKADEDYGRRVKEGINQQLKKVQKDGESPLFV